MTRKSCLSKQEETNKPKAHEETNKPKKHSTRCSPKLLENLVKYLNPKQKETVCKMGFGGLLEVKCGQLDSHIWTKIVERFDTENRELLIGEESFQVTEHDVHSVLGVPIGSKTFDLENHVALVNDLSQFKDKSVQVLKDIMGKGTYDDLFKRAFLLYVLSQFLCPTSKNEASPKLLNTIVDVDDPCKFNWAKLILDWLVKEIKTYRSKLENNTSTTVSIGGCVLFLKIFYFHKCPVDSVKVGADVPIIKNWIQEPTRKRIQYEKKQGLLSKEEVDPLWLREQFKDKITRDVLKQLIRILKPIDKKLIELKTTWDKCSRQIGADYEETRDEGRKNENEGDEDEDNDENEDENNDEGGDEDEDDDVGNQNEEEGDQNENEGEIKVAEEDDDEDEDKGNQNEEEGDSKNEGENEDAEQQMEECEAEGEYAERDIDGDEKRKKDHKLYNNECQDAVQRMEVCEAEGEDAEQDIDGDDKRKKDHKQVEEEESAKKGEAEVEEKHSSGRKRGNMAPEVSYKGHVYKRRKGINSAKKDLCMKGNLFVCHQCQNHVTMSMGVQCTSCKMTQFCESCLHTWYHKFRERGNVKTCPLCRSNCNCNACLRTGANTEELKTNEDKKIEVERSLFVLEKLLPWLNKLDQEQMCEAEIEAKRQGLENLIIKEAVLDEEERVICDKCNTSVYDYHRSCECGIDLCLRCCCEIRNGAGADPVESLVAANSSTDKPPSYSWQAGPDGRIHCPNPIHKNVVFFLELERLLPTQDYISNLIGKAENVAKKFNCLVENNTMKESSCEDSNDINCPSAVDEQNDLTRFQRHWRKGHPVIVRNVLECTSGLSWEPEVMERALCDNSNDSTKNTLEAIDCIKWRKVAVNIPKFFAGYKNGSIKPMLKLKDWPNNDLLHNLLPRHCVEFRSSLPYKEYTDPLAGCLNLATMWDSKFQKPDMGPKMYIAYGHPEELKHGNSVTTLHCDMSDAVNVMTHVAEVNSSKKNVAEVKLGPENIPVTGSSMGGALWDIFQREDADKLEEYLKKNSKKFKSVLGRSIDKVSHAIHDQTFYLTDKDKKELKEHGIEPKTFIQELGDAVLIPAGCPHQVRNLKPCIKVALDFVSPENVHQCINLTEEFRKLAEKDKLQVKKMIIYAVDDVVEKLEKHLQG